MKSNHSGPGPHPVDDVGSISWLLARWPAEEDRAVERIYLEYFPRLRALAQRTLGQLPGANVEADDVVQSALRSFCCFARRKSGLMDASRLDMWRLLCRMVAFKSRRRFRGRGNAYQERMEVDAASPEFVRLEDWVTSTASTEFDVIVSEALDKLDDSLRPVALMLMEQRGIREIAETMNCSTRTIDRKIALIRQIIEAYMTS